MLATRTLHHETFFDDISVAHSLRELFSSRSHASKQHTVFARGRFASAFLLLVLSSALSSPETSANCQYNAAKVSTHSQCSPAAKRHPASENRAHQTHIKSERAPVPRQNFPPGPCSEASTGRPSPPCPSTHHEHHPSANPFCPVPSLLLSLPIHLRLLPLREKQIRI